MNIYNKSIYLFLFLITNTLTMCSQPTNYNKLTTEEERIILNKGTEAPYSGKYYKYNDAGTYLCKRCYAPLYLSNDKFDAHCGWPSFDDEIEGAIKRKIDADGHRTEILCANCGAHLGHVFVGERLTDKNTRHCVNSLSLSFEPLQLPNQNPTDTAIFAGGCFWGMEYYFQNAEGVIGTTVGYIGGDTKNPTYEQVCSHRTGHIEAIEVIFNTKKTNYENLAKLFFEIHDPTQINRQGPDIGEQYKSAVFYKNDNQREIADSLINILKTKGYNIVTELIKAPTFWPAELYHQEYYTKKSGRPYCHFYKKKF